MGRSGLLAAFVSRRRRELAGLAWTEPERCDVRYRRPDDVDPDGERVVEVAAAGDRDIESRRVGRQGVRDGIGRSRSR